MPWFAILQGASYLEGSEVYMLCRTCFCILLGTETNGQT